MPKLSSPTPRSVATNDADTLTGKINEIKAMKTPQLKALWQELYFREAPVMHSNLLKMRLIWRVQEIMKGGLSQRASDELTSLRRRLRRGRIRKRRLRRVCPWVHDSPESTTVSHMRLWSSGKALSTGARSTPA